MRARKRRGEEKRWDCDLVLVLVLAGQGKAAAAAISLIDGDRISVCSSAAEPAGRFQLR